ncbi:MAG: class I SAM-dependent methyltransferase [Candidatus Acidiferrum sp.]
MTSSATQKVSQRIPLVQSSPPPELLAAIHRLRARTSDEFLLLLDERKRQERQWANFSRDRENTQVAQRTNEQSRGNFKWYSTTQLSADFRNDWLAKHAPDKVVLDYACGEGGETLRAARMGASLAVGIDVSNVSIQNAAQAAANEDLSDRCSFIEGDCEDTGLPENSVDVILCCGMLHHLDLTRAYPEMHRILKPGGCVFAQEALNYNPLIKLYRQFTPEMRTKWEKEHILSLKDVRAAKKYFNVGEIRYWHLTSMFAAFARGVPSLFEAVSPVLNSVDNILLAIPGVQMLAWQFTFELIKPNV